MNDWQWIAGIIVLLTVFKCKQDIKQHFIPKLKNDSSFQKVTGIVIAGIFLLWQANAGIYQGLEVHFLGLTVLSLMYGWRIAFILVLTIQSVSYAYHGFSDPFFLSDVVLSGLIPILITYTVFLLTYRYLPKNVFVFIFVAGFFNAGLTGSLHILFRGGFYLISDQFGWEIIADNYFTLIPLLIFPEGLLNGMSLALLCVYRPEWLRVFRDRDYLYTSKD
ncbi:energy-coupling factor ABC transporter permease [Vibrio sp. SCSIO 43136]|uniref:energy-coupling factor ABC transporter permease n=1 Tax=Vibrio sp. SCSIO 43136 TaxID=2819101 RepID=UPI0020752087|nr:energy-coupling factor ABC transporter permease [Vibrio sp. SCSIO 43136]USD66230.1 energy-coupling factor ABC transporter permease [Vibrio sp. SCSIO 43136]